MPEGLQNVVEPPLYTTQRPDQALGCRTLSKMLSSGSDTARTSHRDGVFTQKSSGKLWRNYRLISPLSCLADCFYLRGRSPQ